MDVGEPLKTGGIRTSSPPFYLRRCSIRLFTHVVHLTLWYMMDHNDNSKSRSSSGSIDMQHLINPRGKGYSLTMLTPPVLVGTTNPWTDKPFGKEIKLGLRTRTPSEALRIRDVAYGHGMVYAESSKAI